MTEVLCFALDGTLLHRTRSDTDVLADVLANHGVKPSDELVRVGTDEFRRAFDALEPEPFLQSMAAVVGAADAEADPEAMTETLRERTYEARAVPDAARESLAGLGADSTLAVITDGPREWQLGKLEYHGLGELFDAVVASYEVGAHKPDAAAFEQVRERLPADEYVMVGHSDADIEGARAAGFVPIRYETEGPDLWATIDALL